MRRTLTRRQALGGGGLALAALAAANYGRYSTGRRFEEHVAGVLGTSTAEATSLLDLARERVGDGSYEVRASAFLAATSFPGAAMLPSSLRRGAIGALVFHMIEESADNLTYLGMSSGAGGACAGLLPG